MQIDSIELKYGLPTSVGVTMSIKEVVAIAELFGKMNGYAHVKLGMPNCSIYDALVDDVINRFWDGGTDEARTFAPFTLDTLNKVPE